MSEQSHSDIWYKKAYTLMNSRAITCRCPNLTSSAFDWKKLESQFFIATKSERDGSGWSQSSTICSQARPLRFRPSSGTVCLVVCEEYSRSRPPCPCPSRCGRCCDWHVRSFERQLGVCEGESEGGGAARDALYRGQTSTRGRSRGDVGYYN